VTPSTCSNLSLDGDESDLDCGGSCAPCAEGRYCKQASDCLTALCSVGRCLAQPSCTDRLWNGDESDVDCGGSCPACLVAQKCLQHSDCAAKTCLGGVCRDPSCSDGLRNQDESDIDCGGASCGPCADLASCSQASECRSGRCEAGLCISCGDGVKNGDESDLDCGGSICGICAKGKRCRQPDDCEQACGADLLCRDWIWSIEIADGVGDVGHYASLALDSNGAPHIAYADATDPSFKLASRSVSGGVSVWTVDRFHANGATPTPVSLALDAQDAPHIAYYDSYFMRFAFASNKTGNWFYRNILGSVGLAENAIRLAVSPQGQVGVSYFTHTLGPFRATLHHSTFLGNSWVDDPVLVQQGFGGTPALAYASSGEPQIAFFDGFSSRFRHATHSAAGWVAQDAGSTQTHGASLTDRSPSLALNAQNAPRIAFYDSFRHELNYAFSDGGAWSTEVVDPAPAQEDVGQDPSLALDSKDQPHIAYYDLSQGDLKYATYRHQAWIVLRVATTGDVGRYSSLALDAQGLPHIAFYDATLGDLLYAVAQ